MFAFSIDASGKPQIFVIEDDLDHQKIADMTLKAAGVEKAIFFSTGEEAMEYFQRKEPNSSASGHVIFIDLMLPKISGLEILRRLKEDDRWRSSIMVVLTCSTSAEDRAMSQEYGADEYLLKPLRAESVRRILSSVKQ